MAEQEPDMPPASSDREEGGASKDEGASAPVGSGSGLLQLIQDPDLKRSLDTAGSVARAAQSAQFQEDANRHTWNGTSYDGGVMSNTPPITQIDEYLIQQPLGRGGMGQVFMGYDTLLDRPVAVKFLVTTSPNERARKRFLIEARAIARLQHPNVVAVYRVGISNGLPYLVSELVGGQSLDRLEKPIPWEQALRIGIDLARGLVAVHRQGVLHRDLKPANAMLTPDGMAKLLDFGLAKLANDLLEIPSEFRGERDPPPEFDEAAQEAAAIKRAMRPRSGNLAETAGDADESAVSRSAVSLSSASKSTVGLMSSSRSGSSGRSRNSEDTPPPGPINVALPRTDAPRQQPEAMRLTDSEMLIGTPAYMPPEMWLGAPATEQSDLYMLGELLYELCCGQPPHMYRRKVDQRRAVLHADALPLAQVAPNINPRLARLIDSCVRRDPAERPDSAEQVLQQLEAIAADPTDEATRRRRRRRELLNRLLPLGLAAAGIISTAAVLYRDSRSHQVQSGPVVAQRLRVAVLGLDITGAPTAPRASFARTFGELLASELSAGERLLVLPLESVERAKLELKIHSSVTSPQEVIEKLNRTLGPDLVASGMLRPATNGKKGFTVEVALRNVRTGERVASALAQGSPEDLFAMVSSVGREVRKQLGIAALSQDDRTGLQAERPVSLEVAQLYAEAKTRLHRFDPVGARDLLLRVVAAEPDYPLGYLALADSLLALGYEDRAHEQIRRAFQLASRLPRAARSLIEARYRETTGEWAQAFALYRALQTTFPDEHEYGLELINAQLRGGLPADALKSVAELRKLQGAGSLDARIDLVEAKAQMELSNFTGATEVINRAVQKAESLGSPLLLADALLLDSFDRTNLDDHARSLRSAERARELFEATGNLFGEVDSLVAASNASSAMGDYERAASINERTLQLVMELGNTGLTAVHLGNMADLLCLRGQLNLAVARAQAGLLLARQVGNREAALQSLVILGEAALLRGDVPLAEGRLLQARRELPTPDDPRMSAWVSWHLGELRRAQGKLDEAEALYRSSFEQREQHQLGGFAAESLVALASLALERSHVAEGERQAHAAMERFVKAKNLDSAAWAQSLLSLALSQQQGRADDALVALHAAMARLGVSQNLLVRLRGLAALSAAALHLTLPAADEQQLLELLHTAIAQAKAAELLGGEVELSVRLHQLERKAGIQGTGWNESCSLGERVKASGLVRLAALVAAICQ